MPATLVNVATLDSDGVLTADGLAVIERQPGFEVQDWAAAHRDTLWKMLRTRGAVLFRGMQLGGTQALEAVARFFCADLFDGNGEHPRLSASAAIYAPVFYPEGRKLLWHNENSFNRSWPMTILFGCVKPADTGGETPIVDSRQVYRRLDPSIRRRFEERGVMYVRNYHDGIGLDWQSVFQTTDAAAAETRCREEGIAYEWGANGALRTRWVRPAVARHPMTGDMSWFNQAQHWHPACLDPRTRASLDEMFAPDDFPRNCCYGDGTRIEDGVMSAILDVYEQLEISFPWRSGDILVLDNVSMAHARNPYSGERKLMVAMGDMRTWDDLR